MPDDSTIAPGPLLVGARAAARLCGISLRSWWGLNSAGKTPAPVHLGGRALWRAPELTAWTAAGCPARRRWEILKKGGRT